MSNRMLHYTKKILKSVSFNVQLFYKEVEKAYKVLLPHELDELLDWLLDYTKDKPELRQCAISLNNKM